MVELVKRIAARKGIGQLLAKGSARAAEELGKGAAELAMHVKGMEMPGYEPRGAVGMGLGYATADRGACHLRAWTVYEEVMGELDRFSPEGKSMLVAARMHRKAVMDSLGICEVMGLLPIFATLLADATGWKVNARYNSVYEKLLEDFVIDDGEIGVGERITSLARCFNVREGFGRRDDALPGRFLKESVPAGPVKGHHIEPRDFEKMLSEYYSFCGWNQEGIPTRAKLVELGLEEAARDLWPEV
jgi:aldehyde:ferredoxin oxidoreductase